MKIIIIDPLTEHQEKKPSHCKEPFVYLPSKNYQMEEEVNVKI